MNWRKVLLVVGLLALPFGVFWIALLPLAFPDAPAGADFDCDCE